MTKESLKELYKPMALKPMPFIPSTIIAAIGDPITTQKRIFTESLIGLMKEVCK